MPAFFAFLISSGVRSGQRYRVMRYSTLGSILSSSDLYARACSVVVIGGFRLGYAAGEILPVKLCERKKHHDIRQVEASFTDMWGDKGRKGALTEVDMKICGRGDDDHGQARSRDAVCFSRVG